METWKRGNEQEFLVDEPLLLSSSISTNYKSAVGEFDIISDTNYNNFEMDPVESEKSSKRSGDSSSSKYSSGNSSKTAISHFWHFQFWSNLWKRSRLLTVAYLSFAFVILFFIKYIIQTYTTRSQPISSPSDKDPENQYSHYAIVIDAGSSGSRAYLYAWPSHSGDMHELLKIRPLVLKIKSKQNLDGSSSSSIREEPLVEKVTPGLSSLSDSPEKALEYIRPLMEFASRHIPERYHKETPLYILATAGMRLLSKSEQDGVLSHLRDGINSNYPFLFPDGNLEIISGRQEGIYQWLAINYVLGKLDYHIQKPFSESTKNDNSLARPKTVGAIDMGGASMQIALEIPSSENLDHLTEEYKSRVVDINIGCRGDHEDEHAYRLFVTTFLGYGANEALARHQRSLLYSQVKSKLLGESSDIFGLSSDKPQNDPCLPLGMKSDITVHIEFDKLSSDEMILFLKENLTLSSKEVRLYTIGTGSWTDCYDSIRDFTKESEPYLKECKLEKEGSGNCADNGIHLPSVLHLEQKEFYGFSEFWYSMEDVLDLGGRFINEKLKQEATKYCNTSWDISWQKWKDNGYPKADKERMETQCFKSAWIAAAVNEGFHFPSQYSGLTSAPNTVNGRVAHWTVGALLYRTRYFPLRDIEAKSQSQIHHGIYHPPWASGYLYSHYIVFLCLALVLAAIILYLRRLKRYVRPTSFTTSLTNKIRNILPSFFHRKDPRTNMATNEFADARYPLIAV